MQTTGIFTTHVYPITVKSTVKPIKIIIFGDVHRDSPNHAEDRWLEFLEYAKQQEDAYFFGMGDYLDSTSASERGFLSKAEFHETIKKDLAELSKAKVRKFAQEIAFMKGRLIGLIGGNHYFQFESGATSDHMLCDLMECKFLGVSTLTRLVFESCNRRIPFDIFAHHGAGGARLFGGSITRVDQLREFVEADLFLMGHDHKKGIVPANPRIYLDVNGNRRTVHEHQQYIGRTGSFLAAYQDGECNYNVDAARSPCSLGHVELEVNFNVKTTQNHRHCQLKCRCIS